MEIKVDVLEIYLEPQAIPPGRYNIHCKVETQERSFTNSSIFQITQAANGSRKITQPFPPSSSSSTTVPVEQWMKFSYEFQTRHKEPVVHLKLSDLTNVDNQVELGEGLIPLIVSFNSRQGKESINRTIYLVSTVNEMPLVQQVGHVNLQIIVTYDVTEEGNEQLETTDWTSSESAHSHLQLLHANLELPTEPPRQSIGGESIISDHFVVVDSNTSSFSHDHPVITVIFHVYATEDITASYQTVSYLNLSSNAADLTQNTPFATWNLDHTHERRFQYANILSERSHLLMAVSEKPQLLGLILMKDSRPKPLFSAFENITDMSPFSYIHRAWLTDTFKPTQPSDSLRIATKHIVTSLHYTPPISTYSKYSGLEVALMRFHIEHHQEYVITMEAIHQDNYTQQTEPSFLRKESEQFGEYKLAFLQLHDDTHNPSVYFFYKSEAILDSYRPSSNDDHSTLLVLQIYTIDPASTQPWWSGDITCTTVRSIDKRIYTILKDDIAKKGLRWRIDWEDMNWSIDIVLRLKTKEMMYLQPMTDEELYKLPVLDNPEPPSESPEQLEEIDMPIPSSIEQGQATAAEGEEQQEDEFIESEVFIPRRTTNYHDSDIVHTTSDTNNQLQYIEIITKLTDQIEALQKENATLQQENGYLQGQLDQQQGTTALHLNFDHKTQKELQMATKPELISRILSLQDSLEIETGHKERYQQRVFQVQNELLSVRSKESDYLKLREAHKLQQKLVQDLRRKVTKYYKCYQTTLQQEKVIEQLQGLLIEQEQRKTGPMVNQKNSFNASSLHLGGQNSLPNNTMNEDGNERELAPNERDDVFDTSKIEERLYRLETFTNQAHINQVNFAAMLKESSDREKHLRHNLMITKASMEKLKTENQELKRNVMGLLNIRPKPPAPPRTTEPPSSTL